jgi:hypothetical protein
VGYWTFDEGTGTTAYDYSGNNASGTLTGSGQTWVTGQINKAVNLPSTAGVSYAVPLATNLPSNVMTLSLWVNTNAFTSYANYFNNKWGSYDGSWVMFSDVSGNFYFGVSKGGGQYIDACLVTSTNQWYLLTGTYDGNVVKQYLNGLPCGNTTILNGQLLYQTTTPMVSTGHTGESYSLDDIRLYNRVLSASEISALYNGGK